MDGLACAHEVVEILCCQKDHHHVASVGAQCDVRKQRRRPLDPGYSLHKPGTCKIFNNNFSVIAVGQQDQFVDSTRGGNP